MTAIREVPDRPGPVEDEQYEINEILDSRIHRGKLKYLIRWKGYPYEEASWVPPEDVNANRLFRQFHRDNPLKPRLLLTCLVYVLQKDPW